MQPSDIVSVSDLRTQTNAIFKRLKHPKCIVANNKPQAILMSLKDYNRLSEYLENRETVVDFGKEWVSPKDLLSVHKKIK